MITPTIVESKKETSYRPVNTIHTIAQIIAAFIARAFTCLIVNHSLHTILKNSRQCSFEVS